MPDQPARLCIISRDRFRSGDFVAALGTALDPNDELEIIEDRRRGRPAANTPAANSTGAQPDETDQPSVDRRRLPEVDLALKTDGFAIVPVPITKVQANSSRLSLLLPESPMERLDLDDEDDRERLESVRRFQRARAGRLVSWVVLAGLVGMLAALLVRSPVGILMSWARPEARLSTAPPAAEDRPAPARIDKAPTEIVAETPPPARTETPRPDGSSRRSPTADGPDDTMSARPRSGSHETRTAPIVTRSMSPPAVEKPMPTAPRFPGLPRAEVVRSPTPGADGQAAAYVVRLSDTAGRPLTGAEVLLLARMADGTVETVPLGSGPDPGTYHATMPPTRSAPVDLRLRVMTSDKRVEIPFRP